MSLGALASGHRPGIWKNTCRTGSLTVSGYRFGIWKSTHWAGSLKSGSPQSQADDLGFGGQLTELGAESLGAYNLGPPIWDLQEHSLDWVPRVWELGASSY